MSRWIVVLMVVVLTGCSGSGERGLGDATDVITQRPALEAGKKAKQKLEAISKDKSKDLDNVLNP